MSLCRHHRPAGILLLLTGCLVALLGCASAPQDRLSSKSTATVASLAIRNELPYTVTDALLEIPATGAFIGCGDIMARTDCDISFQPFSYRGDPMRVSWKEHGVAQKTDEFVVKVPEGVDAGATLRLTVTIFAPGQAAARLVGP